jgi:pilus assembly protein CpaE
VALNIKLVSADPQLAQTLRDTGGRCSVVPREALSSLAQGGMAQPELLVLDMREQREFPPALALLKRQHPATAVLLVVSQLEPALMLEAMRAGVNELVTHPVNPAELMAAIKRLSGSRTAPTHGDVFAIVGAKGGVGATTVAVNLASALAKATPDSTLLIDLNVACGDAAVFLGAEPRFSVVDALENVQRLDEAYFQGLVVRSKTGLDLLGSTGRTVASGFDSTRLRTLLDFASQTHRFVVLDVPRSDTTALDALESATKIVLVANQELATVRSASRMAATLRQRYGRDRLMLVLTRTDRRAEIGHEDVERTVGMDVSYTFPSDYRAALQAMNKGRPIVLENHNELAGAFAAFARDLGGISEDTTAKGTKPGSLFGLLAPRRANS